MSESVVKTSLAQVRTLKFLLFLMGFHLEKVSLYNFCRWLVILLTVSDVVSSLVLHFLLSHEYEHP